MIRILLVCAGIVCFGLAMLVNQLPEQLSAPAGPGDAFLPLLHGVLRAIGELPLTTIGLVCILVGVAFGWANRLLR